MNAPVSRRLLLGGLLATAATGACANAPEHSPRPVARPLKGKAQSVPDAEALIAKAALGGKVAYLVADAATGTLLEGRNTREPMAPASTAKTLTTLFAFAKLGQGYHYRTRVVADGRISAGKLDGNLVLVGGGDPTLDTEALATLAARARGTGLKSVSGDLLYWDGALPYEHEITAGQPDHLGYNPAISGLNLNYNRVYFEWRRQGSKYDISMDARSDKRRPEVTMARIEVADRAAPVYTYRENGGHEMWTVARGALGKGGGRWLPVRHPALYTAQVFASLAATQGISMGPPSSAARQPSGPVVAEWQSDNLAAIAQDMLKYSTNMTAEVLGLTASGATSLQASAAAMDAYMASTYGAAPRMVDHSGLGGASRVTAEDMVAVLVGSGPNGPLRPVLKHVPLKDDKGRPMKDAPITIQAKTGTLNFVSCLVGFAAMPSGRCLAFAMLMGDLGRRSALEEDERDRPPGARSWNGRAKMLQQQLIRRWGEMYSA